MAAGKSTRLSIVEQSLEDILLRLESLPPSPRARELAAKARVYERAVNQWPAQAPTEEQRAAMLKCVIELHLEVMGLGREDKAEAK
jgi:hypothetical protein